MNTCIIVHCWEGYPEYCWYPWLKDKLEKEGWNVIVPEMPETVTPTLQKWLPKLQEIANNPNENLYLVGHSLGCITILRYLENLKENQKVGGVVMVAGFTDYLGYEELSTFFEEEINYDEINKHCDKFVAIHSDNDPYVSLEHGDIFKKELGARVVVKNQMGHFSGEIENEESCVELPDVYNSLLEISK
jgi:predicted alpha/beta hydrolase family esterase